MKLIILVILGFACLLNGEFVAEDDAEQLSEPHASDRFENDADRIDQETEDELNMMEDGAELDDRPENKQDPGVISGTVMAIKYYCRYCKIANRCRRFTRSCTSSSLRKSQELCKYCKPATYFNLVRRVRIRLPKVRWGGRRRRW